MRYYADSRRSLSRSADEHRRRPGPADHRRRPAGAARHPRGRRAQPAHHAQADQLFNGRFPGHAGRRRSARTRRRRSACARSRGRFAADDRRAGRRGRDRRRSPSRSAMPPAGSCSSVAFESDGTLSFDVDDSRCSAWAKAVRDPRAGTPWREQPVQFDRRGALDTMEPRWQSDMYGSRNPGGGAVRHVRLGPVRGDALGAGRSPRRGSRRVPAVAAAAPTRPADRAEPAADRRQGPAAGGSSTSPGLYDVFVFDAPRSDRRARRTSPRSPARPRCRRKWALGYMQSHRTLEDETQMLAHHRHVPREAAFRSTR